MTSRLHDELRTIGAFFFLGEISEEEWAILQIHMAYCTECFERFRRNEQASGSQTSTEHKQQ
jgi:hypothetical protein